MTSFSMDVQGLEEHLEELEDEREKWAKPSGTWVVGTAVEYSIYLEFGTSKMDPKPFFRPALAAYNANLEAAVDADTKTTLEEIEGPQELVRTIAFGLERRVKRIITQKGLIESGTMRASVKAVPTGPDDLPTADEVDADASATIEVSA